jgi:hypothetical protein
VAVKHLDFKEIFSGNGFESFAKNEKRHRELISLRGG